MVDILEVDIMEDTMEEEEEDTMVDITNRWTHDIAGSNPIPPKYTLQNNLN